ncbi:hypothetical protein ASD11_17510 [Aeromicrobium sp. Root495]|nr:hypothetical protein ASD11_17510 [Aeromicrobium sp. Root495]
MPEVDAVHPRHLISVRDLDVATITSIFEAATALGAMAPEDRSRILRGRLLTVLFFQPSTRTRIGFESAGLKLGATVSGFSDPSTTRSVDYIGESLEDTIRVIAELGDMIVLRHFVSGAARHAAAVSSVPVINGGDGTNEHPTQALSDAWTMANRLGSVEGAVVGIVGDPGTRVHRSLIQILALLGVAKILLLVPPSAPLRIGGSMGITHCTVPADIVATLKAAKVPYEFCSDVRDMLAEADAIEMMPVSIPGLESDPRSLSKGENVTPEQYRVTAQKIRATGSRALIMHPGPRSDEMHPDVDDLPNGLFFDQVRDSLQMRMAALTYVCGAGPYSRPS